MQVTRVQWVGTPLTLYFVDAMSFLCYSILLLKDYPMSCYVPSVIISSDMDALRLWKPKRAGAHELSFPSRRNVTSSRRPPNPPTNPEKIWVATLQSCWLRSWQGFATFFFFWKILHFPTSLISNEHRYKSRMNKVSLFQSLRENVEIEGFEIINVSPISRILYHLEKNS